jgi:hypothetical protein
MSEQQPDYTGWTYGDAGTDKSWGETPIGPEHGFAAALCATTVG